MKRLTTRPVSRREFIRLSALATAGAVAVACAPAPASAPAPAPAAATNTPAAAAPGKFNEAPMLADLVKAGKLPALDERLPATPGVIDGAESVGQYGGTFRRAFKGVSDRWGPTKMQDRGLAWYDKDLNIRARMAESWEVNADATEWTFHLRKGQKWSDGQPFTTESVKYWYDNEFSNKTLIDYSTGTTWKTGAKNTPLTLEVVDDYTFKFKFADPNPLFIFKVTRPTPAPYSPAHYMKQFHPDLTDDKAGLDAKIKAAGFDSWDKYYTDRGYWFFNPERPSVAPWIAKNPVSQELFLMERNPYFFAVDSAGNQLPYLDKVTHRLFSQPDVLNLWVTNGEIDFQARHMALSNFTLYKENEAKGDYKVLVGTSANHQALQPNHTTKNKPLREFFNNRDVRIALSIAIDRQTINELVFDGLATPRQYSPLSTSPQAYEKQANAHIEYDVKKANELLDAAGYKEKDADGFRKWKDGSGTVSFIIEGTAVPGDADEDAVQQVVKYLAAVGVKASYKGVERSLYEQHWRVNEIEAAWWGGDRTVLPIVAPWIFLGTQTDRPWADAWSLWKNNGAADPNAEEPAADHWITKIWAVWDQIAAEPDSDKRTALFTQILDIWAEEIPMIGVLGEIPAPVIVKNGVHNFLDSMPIDDTTGDEQILNTETYFWDDPAKHV